VVADSTLDDYEAFRRGDHFYIKIPSTEFTAMQPRFRGDGFDDVQVQKMGDSVVISFKLQPGASARVDGGSNRLEVIFFAPSRMAASINNANVSAVRRRVTRNSGASESSATRQPLTRRADVAGPVPPDSPSGYIAGNVPDRASADNATTKASSGIRADNRRESTATGSSTEGAIAVNSPNPAATPYQARSDYSSTYPPTTTAVTPEDVTYKPTAGGISWTSRAQAARQWISMNKAASIGGAALMALFCVVAFVAYRRRRRSRRLAADNTRVQPKYSPDVQLEDMLAARVSDLSEKVAPGPYVDEFAYDNWGESTEELVERDSDIIYESAAPDDFNGSKEEPWELVSAAPNPQVYKGRVQEEREVFEL
jgi:hypothetical protein